MRKWNKCIGDFNVYYREAGEGTLTVSVEGPSKADVNVTPRADGFGTCFVTFTAEVAGEYIVCVRWNGQEVPDSPFETYIANESADARKVTVSSLQDKGLIAGKPLSFTVKYNGAQGKLHGKVETPSGEEEEALIAEVDVAGIKIYGYFFIFIYAVIYELSNRHVVNLILLHLHLKGHRITAKS